ncbi:MAG: glutaredoxin family protein [Agarilytica sp.]
MASFKLCIYFCLMLFVTRNAFAEMYQWTDNNGKIHFSDQKPDTQNSEILRLDINTYESVGVETPNSGKTSGGTSPVIMYSTAWCGYCKKAKRYFRKKGITFTEYDIEKNRAAKAEYDRIGGSGVPVILVGNKRLNGFSEASFERMYRQQH